MGQLFADAVHGSLRSMLFIGGCIMMFSVFLQILTVAGVVGALTQTLGAVLGPWHPGPDLLQALISGFVEITMGTEAAGAATGTTLTRQVVVASGIIAWSGLGVHAQVAAMVHGTGIRLGPYIAARFLHAVLAGALAWLMIGPMEPVLGPWLAPVFAPLAARAPVTFWARLGSSFTVVCGLTAIITAVGTVLAVSRRVAGVWVRR